MPVREHAVWVFADAASASNPISDATARQSLITNNAASKVSKRVHYPLEVVLTCVRCRSES